MIKKAILSLLFILLMCPAGHASFLDFLKDTLDKTRQPPSDSARIISGLKEALRVGVGNTVTYLGQKDGYFANQAVKILLPDEVRKVETLLRGVGFGPKVDEFTLSMNRAAEKAAPLAADLFMTAITQMSFDDARRILQGGNTAATDYLKDKTYSRLMDQFQPAVQKAMGEYRVTQQYEAIASKGRDLPVVGKAIDLDLNRYVAAKALDGLFWQLSQEETRIRTDPKARVTDLLKEVFK